jgi:molybdenum cofactor cytidylyltransferase
MTLPVGHDTVQPHYQGQRGHPVGFKRTCGDALQALQGDEGARGVLRRFPPHLLDVDDEGTVWDVDTPQRLEQAAQRMR